MNVEETVDWLAQVNSGFCYGKEFDDIDKTIPYFRIFKHNGKYKASGFNFMTHDNAPRMGFVLKYLEDHVFPNVKEGDLCGYYSIQLHDTYTYLNDGKIYDDVFTFGKRKSDKGPIVLPDCYFMGDWGRKYHGLVDNIRWEDKIGKAIFVGSTTGNRDPTLNQRIDLCLWGRDKKDWCDFGITGIVQMDPGVACERVPDLKKVLRPQMTLEDQMKYKYMLLIDGNTNKWTVDSFYTKSLSLMMPSKDMLWYYPLLIEGTHFVGVDRDNMIKKIQYYNSNDREAKFIVENGNILASKLFNQNMCRRYLINLFQGIASNK